MSLKNGMHKLRPCAFYLHNILRRLSVLMHGIMLQILVFILSYYGGFSIILLCVVTVLLEYLTDCSIRVS